MTDAIVGLGCAATHGTRQGDMPPLSAWPMLCPQDWPRYVDSPQSYVEEDTLGRCIESGQPYGSVSWSPLTTSG